MNPSERMKLRKRRDRRNVFSYCLKRLFLLIVTGDFQNGESFLSVPSFPNDTRAELFVETEPWNLGSQNPSWRASLNVAKAVQISSCGPRRPRLRRLLRNSLEGLQRNEKMPS